jgi:hypothetical protein
MVICRDQWSKKSIQGWSGGTSLVANAQVT